MSLLGYTLDWSPAVIELEAFNELGIDKVELSKSVPQTVPNVSEFCAANTRARIQSAGSQDLFLAEIGSNFIDKTDLSLLSLFLGQPPSANPQESGLGSEVAQGGVRPGSRRRPTHTARSHSLWLYEAQ